MSQCRIVARVLPDQGDRPRVVYLTGWTVPRRFGQPAHRWSWTPSDPAVLVGPRADAERWIAELRREGFTQAQIVEG